jgi:bifunctional DNA-binding transcriptional regulator/antitoxin component of YhaV-PrlF toxin-antitoxin module
MATQTPLRIDPKGRVGLPRALRDEAHFDAGDEVVASVTGPGQVLLQTREAVREQLWSANTAGSDRGNSLEDVRAMREQDRQRSDAADTARQEQVASDEVGSAQRGEELLRTLGL